LLVETSELSFEPAIESRFDRSICVVPSGVAKKYVDAFLERQTLNKNRGRASHQAADRPAPVQRAPPRFLLSVWRSKKASTPWDPPHVIAGTSAINPS
jgi:heme-degrading monooxygenase HmoA